MIPVYILAGGRSSRFGSDKARAEIDGVPLVRRIADVLAPVTPTVTVVADRPDKYADLGLRTVVDQQPGLGPLGGLAAAVGDLTTRGDAWLLLTCCDLLVARPAWVHELARHAAPPAQAVAFRGDRWDPLFALYHTSAQPTIAAQLRAGDRSLWRLLESLRTIPIAHPADWPPLVQANTSAELEDFRRRR